jgi:hypothetical protein
LSLQRQGILSSKRRRAQLNKNLMILLSLLITYFWVNEQCMKKCLRLWQLAWLPMSFLLI